MKYFYMYFSADICFQGHQNLQANRCIEGGSEISLEENFRIITDPSVSLASQGSSEDCPNFADISYDTLREMAAKSDHDRFIFPQ